jgi:hypothetical protein
MLENRPQNLSNKGTSGFMKLQALVRVTNQGYDDLFVVKGMHNVVHQK